MTRAWFLAGVALLGGCLLRRADEPRFFRPDSAALDAAAEDGTEPPAAGGVAVRLRDVQSEPFLRERIVWRASDVEYGLYEQRRWIDLPAHYVERALRARLRATHGLRLSDEPRAPALRVDVLAFDEVLAPTHVANVVLAVRLTDGTRGSLLDERFDARAAIADGDAASMAAAMGQALDDAVARVADAVKAALPARRRAR